MYCFDLQAGSVIQVLLGSGDELWISWIRKSDPLHITQIHCCCKPNKPNKSERNN